MRSMRRLLIYLRPYRRISVLALVMMVGMTGVDLATPRLVQRIIDQGIARQDMRVVLTTALIMLGVALAEVALSIGNTIYAVRAAQSFATDVRSALFGHIQKLSFANLDHLQTGELLVRLTSDLTRVQMVVMMTLRVLTRAPLLIIGSCVLLVITSGRLSVLMFIILPTTIALIWLFISHARPMFLRVQQRLDTLNNVMQENLSGVRVVKAFVRVEHENARFERANVDLMNESIHVMQTLSLLMPSLAFLINLGSVAAVWFGGLSVVSGDVTVGVVVAFVNYLLNIMFPLMMMGMIVGQLSAAEASAGRILEVLDATPAVQDLPAAQPLPTPRGRVALENVSFSYNGAGAERVLKGINLVAEPGETVAILGATGSGKSSLIQLIPRFYDVTEGRVTLDGVDVRHLPQQILHRQVGVSLQEAVLFSGTILDNIRYGRPEATDEEVIAAAKAAQAHDFILSFPQGYDTLIGQRGVNLSGGQKQRVAIARALLVRPCVLILDDSTSAVDVETEAEIEQALADMQVDCTRFVVAQRISTVLNADKIVVLERGEVAAMGTHDELLASSPIYQEIYESQLGNGVAAHV